MHYTIYVQFDDTLNKNLGAHSGVFSLDADHFVKLGYDRIRYKSSRMGGGYFGYCLELESWTYSTGDYANPCDNILAQSTPTASFDITKTGTNGGDWFVVLDSFSSRAFVMEAFFISAGCLHDDDCGGEGKGVCTENARCQCADGYYGLWCDYLDVATCPSLEVSDLKDRFVGSREYATKYDLLRSPEGKVVQVYDHPVYVSTNEGYGDAGQVDVVFYEGLHWILLHASNGFLDIENPSREQIMMHFVQNPDFNAELSIGHVEFESEGVYFNTPLDAGQSTPENIGWIETRGSTLGDIEIIGAVTATLLCSFCNNETNPCQNGNFCGEDGVCQCTNGATGVLCEMTPLSNGKCDLTFNTATYNYDGKKLHHCFDLKHILSSIDITIRRRLLRGNLCFDRRTPMWFAG